MKTVEELADEWIEALCRQTGYAEIEIFPTLISAYKAGYAQALKDTADPEPIPYETNS